MAYSMDGRTFNTIEELYEYQRQAYPSPTATADDWSAFDPALAAQIGITEPDWNALVGQINGMREGQSGPIPVGPGGSHGTNFELTPDSTPQQLAEGLRGMAYQQVNPDAYPDPVNTQREFIKNIGMTSGLLMGGAALGGAFAGGGAAAGGAGGEALTGVTVPSTVQPINTALPYINGPAAGAFGTGPITSALTGAAANAAGGLLDSSGAPIPGTESTGGGMGGLSSLFGGGLGDWAPLIGGLLGAVDAHNQPDSMTQSTGGTSSSTYGQTLPNEIQAPAMQALASLQQHISNGGGYQSAGVDPMTYAALSQLQNRGTNPFASGGMNNTAPTSSAFASGARANTAPTMSGFGTGQYANTAPTASSFAGGQSINPYLDQVFNAAADSTQNRLGTEFAHAGGGALNSGSHQQARSQELQNLAAGIYAPGYEAERNRQYGAQESSVDRLLAQMDSNLSRQYGAQESGLNRLLSQTEGNLGREYGAAESGLNRLLSQTDSNLARQYGATEGNLSRDLSAVMPMLQGGEYLRNVQQDQLNAGNTSFNQYLAQLQGFLPFFPGTQTQQTSQTGSVTQPLFNNPLAGFAGGSLLGKSLFGG
jgi:hypothetical protein